MSINVQHDAHFLGKKWCNKKVTWLATFKGKISRHSWINKKTKFNYKLNDFNATIIRAFSYIYILLFLPIIQQVLVSLLFSNNVIQKHWYYILLKLNISCYSDYMKYCDNYCCNCDTFVAQTLDRVSNGRIWLEPFTGRFKDCAAPEMIPTPKWSTTLKLSPNWPRNDPHFSSREPRNDHDPRLILGME